MNVIARACVLLGIVLLSAALGLAVTGTQMSGEASNSVVGMGDNYFEPQMLTIPAGTTIMWKNDGKVPHTATSDAGATKAFDSGILRSSETYSLVFDTPGGYAYHCEVHPEMTGAVVVEAAAPPSTNTPTVQTVAPAQASSGSSGPAGPSPAVLAEGLPVGGGPPPLGGSMVSSAILLAGLGGGLMVLGSLLLARGALARGKARP